MVGPCRCADRQSRDLLALAALGDAGIGRLGSPVVASRRSPLVACILTISLVFGGCELIADFDEADQDERTVGPTPIPSLDGSRPIVLDGSVRDGAVVQDLDAGSVIRGMDAGA